ncbi:hypothetical protein WME75_09900 [Sorangium sp. So ce1014]|uniref:hypothetical protein n=1 Tax=Sorangium sp. So ce1014 TaxID=3133326 RepID=UPI003F6075BC
MNCRLDAPEKLAWLEIEGGGAEPRQVSCPRRGKATDVRECVACERYTTLAIHPSGKKIYVVCEPFDDAPAEEA